MSQIKKCEKFQVCSQILQEAKCSFFGVSGISRDITMIPMPIKTYNSFDKKSRIISYSIVSSRHVGIII